MIRFTLRCDKEHEFESWFASNAGFDDVRAAGQICCPICGTSTVEKALMAPAVAAGDARAGIAGPPSDLEAALAEIRRKVEQSSDYVGMNFAAEARAMHLGDIPARPIYGEARGDEARALIEDGVPVAPLPFLPRAKTN